MEIGSLHNVKASVKKSLGLSLRLVNVDELKYLFNIYRCSEKPFYIDITGPHETLSLNDFIEECTEDAVVYILELDSRVLGYLHLFDIDYEIKVAHLNFEIWDNSNQFNKAILKSLEILCSQMEIERIQILMMDQEFRKEELIKKMKFKKEGILKEHFFWENSFHDLLLYSKILRPHV